MPDMNAVSGFLAEINWPVRLMVYGELTLFVIILTSGQTPRRFLFPFLLLVAAIASYLYLSGPWTSPTGPIRLLLIGLTGLTPFALWALALLFFDDGFDLPAWAWPAAVLIGVTAGLLDLTGGLEPVFRNLIRIASLVALGHALWVMVAGLRDDLVQRRRLARVVVVGLVLLQASASLIVELALPVIADREPLEPLSALLILLLTTGLAAALLRPDLPDPEPAAAVSALHVDNEIPAEAKPDPLVEALGNFAEDGRLFESGLTIAVLAEKLGVPEYRLRQTINRHLGFRNFSSFLNHHRIAEAMRRLRDPDLARLPILTIAMDLGYGSLGPFNRAFRAATGVTPTEYRRGDSPENNADS